MKSRFIPYLTLFVATFFHGVEAPAQPEIIDGVAAVVNEEVITFSQVREVVAPRERALRQAFTGQELIDKIKEARIAALRDLIDRELILQEFRKRELRIPDHIMDDRINAIIREEFGGDRQSFIRTLQAQGFTLAQFRKMEREKIIVQAMRQQHAGADLVISPVRIDAYYQENIDDFRTPEQIHLRMITIRNDAAADGTPESAHAMAKEIRGKIVEGADFERMAQMYSEDSNYERGGDWGWIERRTLTEELSNKAFALSTGQVSEVIPHGNNFYIMKVEARKNASVKPVDEVREDIERKLMQAERQKLQQKWIDSLRERAYIKMF